MSYTCTLHPMDPRLIGSMKAKLLGERTDWHFFRRLWRKKQLINKVNQPFKDGLKEMLTGCPDFETDLHLWGRPFFLTVAGPNDVAVKLDELYGLGRERDIIGFFMEELRRISESVFQERIGFKPPRLREPDLGLNLVLRKLRDYYRQRRFEDLGTELGFIMAQLAAVAYPYWHMGAHGLTFLEQLEPPHWNNPSSGLREVFQCLGETVRYLPDRLCRGLSNGIYLGPHEVGELLEIIRVDESAIRLKLTQKQFSSQFAVLFIRKLTEALTYAQSHHYGLLEATDVYEKFPKRYP